MEGDWLELEPVLRDRSKPRRRASTTHLRRHATGEKKKIATPKVQRLQKSARKPAADVKLAAPRTSGKAARKKPAAMEQPAPRVRATVAERPDNALDHHRGGRRSSVKRFRLASDCSGWCSEVLAFEAATNLPCEHLFASETASGVRTICRK